MINNRKIKNWSFSIFLLILIFSCSEKGILSIGNTKSTESNNQVIEYFQFSPDSLPNPKLEGIDLEYCYSLDSLKIATGYYLAWGGEEFAENDSENDWGFRLFVLDDENKLLFQSQGFGDSYLFEPHFYRNKLNDKVIIICQLAFEYFFGGEVFLYENGRIKFIGTMDIESFNRTNEDECLTDIVSISEDETKITFTFQSDSLMINPGGEEFRIVSSDSIYYSYKEGVFESSFSK